MLELYHDSGLTRPVSKPGELLVIKDESFTSNYVVWVDLEHWNFNINSEVVYEKKSVTDETINFSAYDIPKDLGNDEILEGTIIISTSSGTSSEDLTEDTDYTIDYTTSPCTITLLDTTDTSTGVDYYVDYEHRSTIYSEGTDYDMEYNNGRINVLSSGNMENSTNYNIDYDYVDSDFVRKSTDEGTDLVDEKQFYVKTDNEDLFYENITINTINDFDNTTTSGEIDVLYALDDNGTAGTYNQTLSIPDGDYTTAIPIWRKVYSPNVDNAFEQTNITHEFNYDEYVK